jgi:predicted ATPase
MITRIRIQQFRLCRDILIDNAGSILALVGRNGAGKSNILQAIFETARAATYAASESGYIDRLPPGSLVELDFTLDSIAYRYVRGTSGRPNQGHAIVEKLSRIEGDKSIDIVSRDRGVVASSVDDRRFSIGEAVPCLPALSTLLPADDSLARSIAPSRSFLSSIRYYPIDEPVAEGNEDRPVPHNEYLSWLANRKSTGNAENSVLMRIIDMSVDPTKAESLRALRELLGPNGLGLLDLIHVARLSVNSSSATAMTGPGAPAEQLYYRMVFFPSRGQNIVPQYALTYNELSLGTRRVLRMFASMLFDGSSVMLLEQPEDSLHQGLTKKVIGLLRQNAEPSQLIISSHSSALLNKVRPEEIRIVSLREGFTSVRKLSPDELQIAADFMNNEGPLYEFLQTIAED